MAMAQPPNIDCVECTMSLNKLFAKTMYKFNLGMRGIRVVFRT